MWRRQGRKSGMAGSLCHAVLLFLTGFLLVACGADQASDQSGPGAEAPVVNFFNWSDYIADTTLPAFQARTGIKVNYDIFDSNDMLEGKLLAGNTGYDIVVPSGDFFEVQRSAGLFQPIDRSRLKNYGNLDPEVMKYVAEIDPDNKYAVPYMWGTNGLGYNRDKILERMPDAPLNSWDLLLKPEIAARFADCGIVLLDAADDVQAIALIYLGLDPHTDNREDVERAMALIEKIRPYVRYFHSSQYIDDLANGEVCLAFGFSGDIFQARDDAKAGITIDYIIPKEGTIVWFDLMAIPADAPHPGNAHKLIDYLLEPEVAAANTNAVWYTSPNKAAIPYINPEILNDPAIYPPPEVMARLKPDRASPPKIIRIRNRIWTRVKTGR